MKFNIMSCPRKRASKHLSRKIPALLTAIILVINTCAPEAIALMPLKGTQDPQIIRQIYVNYWERTGYLNYGAPEHVQSLSDRIGVHAAVADGGKIIASDTIKGNALEIVSAVINAEVDTIVRIAIRDDNSEYLSFIKGIPDKYASRRIIVNAFTLIILRDKHCILKSELSSIESRFLARIEPLVNAQRDNPLVASLFDDDARRARICAATLYGASVIRTPAGAPAQLLRYMWREKAYADNSKPSSELVNFSTRNGKPVSLAAVQRSLHHLQAAGIIEFIHRKYSLIDYFRGIDSIEPYIAENPALNDLSPAPADLELIRARLAGRVQTGHLSNDAGSIPLTEDERLRPFVDRAIDQIRDLSLNSEYGVHAKRDHVEEEVVKILLELERSGKKIFNTAQSRRMAGRFTRAERLILEKRLEVLRYLLLVRDADGYLFNGSNIVALIYGSSRSRKNIDDFIKKLISLGIRRGRPLAMMLRATRSYSSIIRCIEILKSYHIEDVFHIVSIIRSSRKEDEIGDIVRMLNSREIKDGAHVWPILSAKRSKIDIEMLIAELENRKITKPNHLAIMLSSGRANAEILRIVDNLESCDIKDASHKAEIVRSERAEIEIDDLVRMLKRLGVHNGSHIAHILRGKRNEVDIKRLLELFDPLGIGVNYYIAEIIRGPRPIAEIEAILRPLIESSRRSKHLGLSNASIVRAAWDPAFILHGINATLERKGSLPPIDRPLTDRDKGYVRFRSFLRLIDNDALFTIIEGVCDGDREKFFRVKSCVEGHMAIDAADARRLSALNAFGDDDYISAELLLFSFDGSVRTSVRNKLIRLHYRMLRKYKDADEYSTASDILVHVSANHNVYHNLLKDIRTIGKFKARLYASLGFVKTLTHYRNQPQSLKELRREISGFGSRFEKENERRPSQDEIFDEFVAKKRYDGAAVSLACGASVLSLNYKFDDGIELIDLIDGEADIDVSRGPVTVGRPLGTPAQLLREMRAANVYSDNPKSPTELISAAVITRGGRSASPTTIYNELRYLQDAGLADRVKGKYWLVEWVKGIGDTNAFIAKNPALNEPRPTQHELLEIRSRYSSSPARLEGKAPLPDMIAKKIEQISYIEGIYDAGGYFHALEVLGLKPGQYYSLVAGFPNADKLLALCYDEANRYVKDHSIRKPYGVQRSKITAKNLILAALDTIDGFKDARERGDVEEMVLLYRANVKGYTPKDRTRYKEAGQKAFFLEAGGLDGLVNQPYFKKKCSAAEFLRLAVPELMDLSNPHALNPLDVERHYWTNSDNAKHHILQALDTIPGFKEVRGNGSNGNGNKKADIKEMARLYRNYVIGYKSPFTGISGQVAFFYEIGGLETLMSNKYPYFKKVNSPAELLRLALPGLIDLENPDALDPLEVEIYYWNDPANAIYHTRRALDKISGFSEARVRGDVKEMAKLYREKVMKYEPADKVRYRDRGQLTFFYEVGGLAGLASTHGYLRKANSPAELVRLAIPGLIDDNNSDALKRYEVEHVTSDNTEFVRMTRIDQINSTLRPVIPEGTVLWHILDRNIMPVWQQKSGFITQVNKASRKSKATERIYITMPNESIRSAIDRLKGGGSNTIFDVALANVGGIKDVPSANKGEPEIKMLVFDGGIDGDMKQVGAIIAALRALHLRKEDVMPTLLRIYGIVNDKEYSGYIPSADLIDSPKEFAHEFVFDLPPIKLKNIDDIPKLNKAILEILLAA